MSRIATSILFIVVLLFVYANLPEKVGLMYDDSGRESLALERSIFFYLSLGFLLVVNLLNTIFVKAFEPIPVRPDKFFFGNDLFKERFLSWLAAFAPVMNLFFVFVVSFVGIYNNGDLELIRSYGYLAYLGQFLVFLWLGAIIPIVLMRNDKHL